MLVVAELRRSIGVKGHIRRGLGGLEEGLSADLAHDVHGLLVGLGLRSRAGFGLLLVALALLVGLGALRGVS